MNKDNDIKEHLSDWLKWWTSRKKHIFRAFKLTTASESNLAEVIYSEWISARKTHLSIYDAAVDDITEHITIKQMVRQFKRWRFSWWHGTINFLFAERYTFARQDNILSTIIPQQRSNYNEENVEIDREEISSSTKHLGVYLDTRLNFSRHIKEKILKAMKGVTLLKKFCQNMLIETYLVCHIKCMYCHISIMVMLFIIIVEQI